MNSQTRPKSDPDPGPPPFSPPYDIIFGENHGPLVGKSLTTSSI